MQLIWISGSTAQVKKIYVSQYDLIKAGLLICVLFTLLGVGIHFFGFRVAVEFRPDLARQMGGVVSATEQSQIEAQYREELKKLQNRLDQTALTINELSEIKDRIASLVTPVQLKNRSNESNSNKGGPFRPIQLKADINGNFALSLNETLAMAADLHSLAQKLPVAWQQQYQWLNQLPTGTPIAGQLGLSSNYGSRVDPITKSMAFHPGIDFNAPRGTKIISAGNGVVLKAGLDSEYGQFIEIEHIDGLKTKYAHAQKLLVQSGDKVIRGQAIGEVGNTGRSTGPHLHYEVYQDKVSLNPSTFLIGLKQPAQN